VNSALPLTCIIGAGSSGITAARSLHQRRIPFDLYEAGPSIGGNWVFGNANGMSSAYRNLHSNTSRDRMQYEAYPMPRSYPAFPHHSQIARYFEDFVDHFGFREQIKFNTTVIGAERGEDGIWTVKSDDGETRHYDALLVANGHHWLQYWPDPPYPGSFDGPVMHAHEYIDNEQFRDRNILIVGMGNSAMDIAVESSNVARRTLVSTRRGQHILPKWLFGAPLDQLGHWGWSTHVPWRIREAVLGLLVWLTVGRPEDYGLPRPSQRIGRSEVSVSSRFPDRVLHGKVEIKPGIEALAGRGVRFLDGSEEAVDVIVYCTGYRIAFPFFDERLLRVEGNAVRLYRNLRLPHIDNLFFIGLLQPLGAHMPLAEAQGEWVAEYLLGRYRFPPRRAIERDIRKVQAANAARYVRSPRHTIQVDRDDYPVFVKRELRRGVRRAAAEGYAPPLNARAATLNYALAHA
jgi:dimethylaniline monooxygenase (N-oxide forming)